MAASSNFFCGESLDIYQAESIAGRLEKSLQRSFTIELDAHSVSKVDTAGLQLFVSLSQELRQRGGKMIWKEPSEILIDSAQRLGVAEELGLS